MKINSICPTYPIPSSEVTNKILDLKDSEVNDWMIKQYKLSLQLEECGK